MSRGILSKVIEEIGETQAEIRAEDYTMVNVRFYPARSNSGERKVDSL